MFQQNTKSIINYGSINHQTKISKKTDLFYKQTSLNLVIFDKNKDNLKNISKYVKSQFVNRGLHVIKLISLIVLCCCVILM